MGKKDLYSMYNDIDDMISSIEINPSDIIRDEEKVVYIEDEYDELNEVANNEFIDEDDIEILDVDDDSALFNHIQDTEDKSQEIDSESKLKEIDQIFNEDNDSKDDSKKSKKEKNKDKKKQKIDKKSKKEKKNKKSKEESDDDLKEETNKKKNKKIKKSGIVFAVLDLIAIVCLFLMYGPISYFRNLWVTSAMTTMNHKYLAYIFFNQSTIDKILSENTFTESGDDTNTSKIGFDNGDPGVYENEYEEQVLKRDKGNNLYKVIDISGNNYKGHMLVVYDPSRITLAEAKNIKYGGRQLENLVKDNNAIAGINASGFSRMSSGGLVPTGTVIMNHKIVYDGSGTGWGGGIIGFTDDNKLILTKATSSNALKMGIRDAVSFGPFLIVNGVPATFKGNGGYGLAPRTAIAQRQDGIVLLLVIDGRRPGHSLGIDMVEFTNILIRYKAYNASNLDGGGSSSIVVNNEVLSVAGGYGYSGERYLPNAWIVK